MNFRFLLTSRWLGYLALTAFFAAVCAGLGVWQLGRHDEVVRSIARVNANYTATPVDFATAKPWLSRFDPAREWTPITLTGHYLTDGQRVVRNRPNNGQPGYEVVVPFRLTTGETVIVDRGWLPIGDREAGHPDTVPQPASGELTVVGRLKAGEPTVARGAPAGQIASINLPDYSQELGYPLMSGSYLQIASESPAAAQMPVGFTAPSIDEGTNLSYAMQWFAFGVLFFIGYGYVAYQQAKIERDEADDEAEAALESGSVFGAAIAQTKARRARTVEVEDELLDAQGFQGGTVPMTDQAKVMRSR
ncbi:SURF1 family protein [Psychromicrobium xiongbiense]|uniref:SURF1 family cytochrome oxidase biogenesis protein n=1 Tax=Psychromicrobium xiongbiense TaxID=3051184 RepID=UPI002552CB44|nr:SURF1 family protein [Psychromicrobium sp. YIM S02556]